MNNIMLIGNVARDIDLHVTANGIKSAKFTVAVNRKFRNAQGVKEADFIPCVVWRERADFAEKYITKGKKIAVQGELQMRSYETQDGSKRTVFEVQVDEIELLGAKGEAKEETKEEMKMTPAGEETDSPF